VRGCDESVGPAAGAHDDQVGRERARIAEKLEAIVQCEGEILGNAGTRLDARNHGFT
jgi:hypothetical protein